MVLDVQWTSRVAGRNQPFAPVTGNGPGMVVFWMVFWVIPKNAWNTVDGCEILHHQKDGWNPINNGINHRFQLVQDFFHPPYGGWNHQRYYILERRHSEEIKFKGRNSLKLDKVVIVETHKKRGNPWLGKRWENLLYLLWGLGVLLAAPYYSVQGLWVSWPTSNASRLGSVSGTFLFPEMVGLLGVSYFIAANIPRKEGSLYLKGTFHQVADTPPILLSAHCIHCKAAELKSLGRDPWLHNEIIPKDFLVWSG